MAQTAQHNIQFGPFILDVPRGCVRRGDQEIALRPKTFEVLRRLVENAGRIVSKEELFQSVWPTVTVTDDSLVQCIRELREKLGDRAHALIKTVPRRGYLLEASTSAAATTSSASDVAFPVPDATSRHRHLRAIVATAAVATMIALLVAVIFITPRISAKGSPAVATSNPNEPIVFRDCPSCPEMVALPAGHFMMGSPADDPVRLRVEGLPRQVEIPKPFAIGRFEVTISQYETFVTETGLDVGNTCRIINKYDGDVVGLTSPITSFRHPGYEASGDHPVGCISLHQAQAFAAWLRRRTGKPYRLPNEAEWEYAARAGSTTLFSFGDEIAQLCDYGRFADLSTPFAWKNACRTEGASYGPLKVGSLRPNPWGLFDMHGNVWEWMEDCWTANPAELPTDGSALVRPEGCDMGVLRGGSWASSAGRLRSAMRLPFVAASQHENMGFRVALTLPEPARRK
jgi:formylglycine-generating enzyme required for sulfatase activity